MIRFGSENVTLLCGELTVVSRVGYRDVHLEILNNIIFGFVFLSEV